MRYVVTTVRPPEGEAKYGKASITDSVPTKEWGADCAFLGLRNRHDSNFAECQVLREQLTAKPVTTALADERSGVVFRIDDADIPPNVCPCCGRAVWPEDALFAGDPKTECDGCYPWHRTTPVCLPANTAHPTKES